MTQNEWDEATDVDEVPAHDTQPAPGPTPPPEPPELEHFGSPIPAEICVVCDGMHGNHDPACPFSPAVAP